MQAEVVLEAVGGFGTELARICVAPPQETIIFRVSLHIGMRMERRRGIRIGTWVGWWSPRPSRFYRRVSTDASLVPSRGRTIVVYDARFP
jgi:hypothetical protein